MGILGNQDVRRQLKVRASDIDVAIEAYQDIASKRGVALDTVLRFKEVLELERATTVKIDAGDYWDEQAGGFADCLRGLAEALRDRA